MVRLEHLNLVVTEIQPTVDFLLSAFPQWHIRGKGENRWGNTARNWVHVGSDDYYLTLNDGAKGNNRDLSGMSPGLAHIGFVVEDLESVISRLTDKGYAIDVLGRDHPFRKTAYFVDPAGFQFEFMQYTSEKAQEKNLYGGETGELTRFN